MGSPDPVRLVLVGGGLMGRQHAAAIARCEEALLVALVDPAPGAAETAAELGAPLYPDLDTALAGARPDGVILATPSGLHAEQGAKCLRAGIPVLIEKPLAITAVEAAILVDLAKAEGVPLAVGHHRRHNPLIVAAKAALDAGRVGRITAVHAFAWLMKPPEYFEPDWRRGPGAGPILTNLIHDIDLLRHLCGDIAEVQAMTAHALRGHAVEDTATATLRFTSGALGTVTLSDCAVGPWSWELTAGENPVYPETAQSCYQIAGSEGALEIPTLRLWRNTTRPGWHEPIMPETLAATHAAPLPRQIAQFAAVIRGTEPPLVTGADGLAAMRVLDAIRCSAETGRSVKL